MDEDRAAGEARARAAEEMLQIRDKEIEDMRMKLERAKFVRVWLSLPHNGFAHPPARLLW